MTDLARLLGDLSVAIIEQDSYYRDRSHQSPAERELNNYDHPDAIQTDLLLQHLSLLRSNKPVDVPVYDFTSHTRQPQRRRVTPGQVVLVEGTLIFVDPDLRDQFHLRVFVEADNDVCLIRRLQRDLRERGRDLDSVIEQYLATVKPMHSRFVATSKDYAHIAISGQEDNQHAVSELAQRIRTMVLDSRGPSHEPATGRSSPRSTQP